MFMAFMKAIVRPLALAVMFAMMICTLGINPVCAENLKAAIGTDRTADKNEILVNEKFKLNYSIQPQPIPCEIQTPSTKREIVLVVDTSGSMRWNIKGKETNIISERRITIAKNAALKFIENIKEHKNVKVALVTYANYANVKVGLTDDFEKLKREINKLDAYDGTNIGDGLRRAYYELFSERSSSDAEKYIVMLTDGEPTFHSYVQVKNRKVFFLDDGPATKIAGGGSRVTKDDEDYCYEVVNKLINTKNINTYFIGFTDGSDKNILKGLAAAAGGEFRAAKDSDALENVYEDISEVVISDYSVTNVTFEETFPVGLEIVDSGDEYDNITVDGRKVSVNLGGICYKYNMDRKQYEAESVSFELELKGKLPGSYVLGYNKSSKLKYRDIDSAMCEEYFPEIQVTVISSEPTPTPTPEPYGYPELKVKNIIRSGEKVKVELDITLPEDTREGRIIFDAAEIGDIEVNATGTYTIDGLSIYKTYTVTLEATSNSGETRTAGPITIFRAIDVN